MPIISVRAGALEEQHLMLSSCGNRQKHFVTTAYANRSSYSSVLESKARHPKGILWANQSLVQPQLSKQVTYQSGMCYDAMKFWFCANSLLEMNIPACFYFFSESINS